MRTVVFGVIGALLLQGHALAATPGATGKFEVYGGMGGGDGAGYAIENFDDNVATAPVEKQIVPFAGDLSPGSILVKTNERKLYFILPNHKAMLYPVGVGREGFTWSGRNRVARKAEWPTWRPPAVMIAREAERGRDLPEEMPGGPKNPLGARALYIGSTEYRIHGTTQPWSIGRAVSSGCIRMLNAHVIDLYNRVSVGATVVVER
jgi:lipoprotein-anchoring transpeptidase ErfK/SrfK